MSSKNARDQKSKSAGKVAKSVGELKGGDLDKVTGGLKVGGATPKPAPVHSQGDPCEGGE